MFLDNNSLKVTLYAVAHQEYKNFTVYNIYKKLKLKRFEKVNYMRFYKNRKLKLIKNNNWYETKSITRIRFLYNSTYHKCVKGEYECKLY